jgi:hypothetical protein
LLGRFVAIVSVDRFLLDLVIGLYLSIDLVIKREKSDQK